MTGKVVCGCRGGSGRVDLIQIIGLRFIDRQLDEYRLHSEINYLTNKSIERRENYGQWWSEGGWQEERVWVVSWLWQNKVAAVEIKSKATGGGGGGGKSEWFLLTYGLEWITHGTKRKEVRGKERLTAAVERKKHEKRLPTFWILDFLQQFPPERGENINRWT